MYLVGKPTTPSSPSLTYRRGTGREIRCRYAVVACMGKCCRWTTIPGSIPDNGKLNLAPCKLPTHIRGSIVTCGHNQNRSKSHGATINPMVQKWVTVERHFASGVNRIDHWRKTCGPLDRRQAGRLSNVQALPSPKAMRSDVWYRCRNGGATWSNWCNGSTPDLGSGGTVQFWVIPP